MRSSTGELLDFKRPRQDHAFRACRDLLAYWDGLRRNRIMPTRMEFDPRGIEATLNSTFIAEQVAPRVARIRVAGTSLNNALGMDVRGIPITAFFAPDEREALSDAIRSFFAEPSQLTLSLTMRRGFARKSLDARAVFLPLCDENGAFNRMVGCLDTGDFLIDRPSRFALDGIEVKQLVGLAPQKETPLIAPHKPVPATEKPMAFAEAQAPFRPKRKRPNSRSEQRAKLRLVVNNA